MLSGSTICLAAGPCVNPFTLPPLPSNNLCQPFVCVPYVEPIGAANANTTVHNGN